MSQWTRRTLAMILLTDSDTADLPHHNRTAKDYERVPFSEYKGIWYIMWIA